MHKIRKHIDQAANYICKCSTQYRDLFQTPSFCQLTSSFGTVWTFWRFCNTILADDLILPAGMTLDGLQWEWVPAAIPWIDKLRDMKADDQPFSSAEKLSRSRRKYLCEKAGNL